MKINNYIKVEVISKRINQSDHQIKAIGKLLDFANEKEVEDFYGSVILDDIESNEEEGNNFII